MQYNEIYERFSAIVAEESGEDVSRIKPNTDIQKDLKMDSLDIVELMMHTEDVFKMEIPDEESDDLNTVEAVCKYIEKNQKK